MSKQKAVDELRSWRLRNPTAGIGDFREAACRILTKYIDKVHKSETWAQMISDIIATVAPGTARRDQIGGHGFGTTNVYYKYIHSCLSQIGPDRFVSKKFMTSAMETEKASFNAKKATLNAKKVDKKGKKAVSPKSPPRSPHNSNDDKPGPSRRAPRKAIIPSVMSAVQRTDPFNEAVHTGEYYEVLNRDKTSRRREEILYIPSKDIFVVGGKGKPITIITKTEIQKYLTPDKINALRKMKSHK
jgi:hypothetical protein